MEPLTVEQAQEVFRAMAAHGDEIAFRWLYEGCECRAHAVLFYLKLGEPPLTDVGGSGFSIEPDPEEGGSTLAHRLMRTYLDMQRTLGTGFP